MTSYSRSVVTVQAVSCSVFEIMTSTFWPLLINTSYLLTYLHTYLLLLAIGHADRRVRLPALGIPITVL